MLCTKCGNKRASGAVCKKCGSPLLSRLSDEIPSDQDIAATKKENKKKDKNINEDEYNQAQSIEPEVLTNNDSFFDSSVSVPTDFKFSDDSDPLFEEINPLDNMNANTAKPVHKPIRRAPRKKSTKLSKKQIKQIIVRIVITLLIAIAVYYIISAIFSPGFFIFGF